MERGIYLVYKKISGVTIWECSEISGSFLASGKRDFASSKPCTGQAELLPPRFRVSAFNTVKLLH